jgi:Tol biopolymer transport system component
MSARLPTTVPDEQLRRALSRDPDPHALESDFTAIVVLVGRTRQRSGTATRLWLLAAALAVLSILVMLAVVTVIGSRPSLPPPFGLARTGLVAFDVGGDIWVANPDGSDRRQLTSGAAWEWEPNWSPDGTKLVYWSGIPPFPEDPATPRHLMMRDMSGSGSSGATLLVSVSSRSGWRVAWAPDSRRLAYADVIDDVSKLFTIDLDARKPIPIGPAGMDGMDPAWAPDGRSIAFLGHRFDAQAGLYLMRPDGSGVHRLTKNRSARDSFLVPVWSPSSDRLAFAAAIGASQPVQKDIWVVGLDGAAEVDISNDPADEGEPDWSPDGTSVGYVREIGPGQHVYRVVITTAEGGGDTRLSADVIDDTAKWSPDAGQILESDANQDGTGHVIAIDRQSGRTTVLANGLTTGVGSWQRLAR